MACDPGHRVNGDTVRGDKLCFLPQTHDPKCIRDIKAGASCRNGGRISGTDGALEKTQFCHQMESEGYKQKSFAYIRRAFWSHPVFCFTADCLWCQ